MSTPERRLYRVSVGGEAYDVVATVLDDGPPVIDLVVHSEHGFHANFVGWSGRDRYSLYDEVHKAERARREAAPHERWLDELEAYEGRGFKLTVKPSTEYPGGWQADVDVNGVRRHTESTTKGHAVTLALGSALGDALQRGARALAALRAVALKPGAAVTTAARALAELDPPKKESDHG